MEDNKECIICQRKTQNVFNIKFKATAICEDCANIIALQQIKDLVRRQENNFTR